ncbi:MAG: ABC transporter ATP-binding protein/permease [Proteobacteria bacterium]|nr:ABC transporter ATP-binding protein/permease [Pseudomonadota bacterium]
MAADAATVAVTATSSNDGPRPGGGFRGLMRLVATRPWSLGGAAVLGALAAAAGLGPYVAVYWIAESALSTSPDMDAIWRYALIGVGLTLLKFVLAIVSHSLAHVGAFGVLYDLRIRLAKKMARVPLGFFNRRDAGSLQKAMSDDVSGLEAFLAHMLPDAAAAFSVPLVAFAVMIAVDWRMTLASLAAVPFAIIAQVAMLRGANRDAYDQYHNVNEATKRAVLEYLRGIHVVKAFGLEAKSFGELKTAVDQMTDYVEGYAERSAPPMIIALKLMGGGTNALFIVPVGAWLYASGSLDAATLVFFLLVGTQVLSPFLRIANVLGNLQLLLRGAENIQRVLDEPELPTRAAAGAPDSHEIRFVDVDFAYGDQLVLRDVSFTAPAGKVTAIVGASGAGKSTVVRLIARFWDVTRGRIEVGGVDVRDVALDEHLARTSLVFQDVFLFHGTVRDNLRLARPEASDSELEAACKVARIRDVISALPQGYDTLLGERGARLSGGERQRLSLARAVLKNAPLLLLDEATAFADAENEVLIHEALAEVTRGKTVLVIAHRLSTIRNADHIVVLDRGARVDAGPHKTLIERCSVYRALWQSYDDAAHWALAGADDRAGVAEEIQ